MNDEIARLVKEHDERIRADERAKTIDELINELKHNSTNISETGYEYHEYSDDELNEIAEQMQKEVRRMIKHTMYRCEYCKTEYANEKDCRECEKNHADYLAIDQTVYVAKCKYPTKIFVSFKDGEKRLYRA